MKKALLLMILLAIGLVSFAEEGFFQGSADSALSKAKAEDKLLFLKFYSDT